MVTRGVLSPTWRNGNTVRQERGKLSVLFALVILTAGAVSCVDTPDDDSGASPSPSPVEAPTVTPGTGIQDQDGDGYGVEQDDCDDQDPRVYPGGVEIAYDGVDQDCDGQDLTDVDGDGYDSLQVDGPDCDDGDPEIHPGAEEVGDGRDNDCDGLVDEGVDTVDNDGDGYAETDGDCDDADPNVSPGADEAPYDGIDQDCDGYDLTDVDGDGYDGGMFGPDCDDADPDLHPGADEVPYDGVDQDCDGYDLTDVDGDGAAGGPEGDDCDDEDPDRGPFAHEIPYDGIDQDCDGYDLTDVDGDGYVGADAGGDDCDDTDVNTHPGAIEFADGKDNDCDGKVDEELGTTDDDEDGFSEEQGDCNDDDATIHPGADEVPYDGVDQDCDGADLTDMDGDGYAGGTEGADCNDDDATIHPGADEVPYDGVDQDCDGVDLTDMDGDGHTGGVEGDDCDDTDPDTYLGADEVPYDGVDQDCDGSDLADVDGDGFLSDGVPDGTDCNDDDPAINPAADEVCDGVDNDCDGETDGDAIDRQLYYTDADQDGFGDPGAPVEACAPTTLWVVGAGDCDDTDATVNPDGTETCDGVDNDCDGDVDEGLLNTYYADFDKDGYGDPDAPIEACTQPSGYVTDATDCWDASDSVHPGATEFCNGIDDDCDEGTPGGGVDEGVLLTSYADADGDGFGDPATETQECLIPDGYVLAGTDCDDTDPAINPDGTEICDDAQTDENCNGLANDEDPTTSVDSMTTFYPDEDGDGFGADGEGETACLEPVGALHPWVTIAGDCDDTQPTVNPGGTEVANGIDDDCDGETDEGTLFTSCLRIKEAHPSATTGEYVIDPDGSGPVEPLTVFCDMVTDGGGYTMVRFDDSVLGGDQNTYASYCAAHGLEIIVPRTRSHAMSILAWNDGDPPNLVNVFPKYNGAYGLSNWTGRCQNEDCSFWMSDSDSCGCTNFEPNGDNSVEYRLYRRADGCEFGNWNDAYNRIEIQGSVICSTNDK